MYAMIEHEKKYRVDSHESIADSLAKLGFKKNGTSAQKDTYFTRADVDFMETKECLRIREEDSKCELTYKPPTTKDMEAASSIWKKETNIDLTEDGVLSAEELLRSIGCLKLCVVDKHRVSYIKDNLTVALDTIVGLGLFVERENLATDKQDDAIAIIESLAADLGILVTDTVKLPYRDLVMDAQALDPNPNI